jgi:SAM-dependent methyltransferase
MEVENQIIKDKIEHALRDPHTKRRALIDFSTSFSIICLDNEESNMLATKIIKIMELPISLEVSETKVKQVFAQYTVSGKPFIQCIACRFAGRAELICEQLLPFLKHIKGRIIDYGAGNGQVSQLLHDEAGLDIEGVDVRDFRLCRVTVPIKLFDGYHVDAPDGYYEAGLMTNVAHHEKENDRIIEELARIIRHKLVVIETVPAGSTPQEIEKDRGRTFLNDALWNRYFWDANIPVPGTYDTPEGWIAKFQKHGWRVVRSISLGIDQPVVRDIHHLFVFQK